MKKVVVILAILAVLAAMLVVGRNTIVKSAMIRAVGSAMGADLEVEEVRIGIRRSRVEMRGLRLKNPAGFGGGDAAVIPAIDIDYLLGALLRGKVHFREISLWIDELNIVRGEDGRLNLDALQPETETREREARREEPEKEEKPPTDFLVEKLGLRVGRANFYDLKSGRREVIELEIDEEFSDVSNSADVWRLILITATRNSLFRRLTGLDLKTLESELSESARRELGLDFKDGRRSPAGLIRGLFE